jgi:hypothetical protein
MTLLRETPLPDAREAEENLRVIREMMERSTRHSTFSGASGIFAGGISIVGCVLNYWLDGRLASKAMTQEQHSTQFVLLWAIVTLSAIGMDYLLTKRKAASVGKLIWSRLGKQMVTASLPGLGTGVLLTLFFWQKHLLPEIYPFWMLCYGTAVCAVGLFSQREVMLLGRAFLAAGVATFLLGQAAGLPMMGVTFGGFHILYALAVAQRERREMGASETGRAMP